MKNRTYIYDIDRPKPKHGHRYTKYKKLRLIIIIIPPYIELCTCIIINNDAREKFYIRRNNSKFDYIETGCIVIADLFP